MRYYGFDYNFGRQESPDRSYESKYHVGLLGLPTIDVVERVLRIPPKAVLVNDQGGHNKIVNNKGATQGCVGHGCSKAKEILDAKLAPKQKPNIENPKYVDFYYDGSWLYTQTRLNDGNPFNDPPNDLGTYIWAAMMVLQKQGHCLIKDDGTILSPDPKYGIANYYWIKTMAEAKLVIAKGWPVVLGIPWPESFMLPVTYKDESWVGLSNHLGAFLGGHCIVLNGYSSSREYGNAKGAGRISNTWGSVWKDSWVPENVLDWLLQPEQGGEACVMVDKLGMP